MSDLWDEWWNHYFDKTMEREPSFDPYIDYYRSGRASKAWPEKETPEWWAENGPRFVDLWLQWRDVCGLTIHEVPNADGEAVPAIELEVLAEHDPEPDRVFGAPMLYVKSVIDRVMTDGTDLYIVDLKTGSSTPPWPLQLALNNLCLGATYGEYARYGGFWSARKGGVEKWFDLSIYTPEWLWDMVAKAREIRDQQLFIPNPNNLCASACGVRQYCVAMGGSPPPFFETDATMTHNQEGNPA